MHDVIATKDAGQELTFEHQPPFAIKTFRLYKGCKAVLSQRRKARHNRQLGKRGGRLAACGSPQLSATGRCGADERYVGDTWVCRHHCRDERVARIKEQGKSLSKTRSRRWERLGFGFLALQMLRHDRTTPVRARSIISTFCSRASLVSSSIRNSCTQFGDVY